MEVTKKDVEKLIELRKEDSFLNHLWNVFSSDFRTKGEINQREIKVWEQNGWNKTFYPIFKFEINSNNHLTNITDTLNPIGKTLIGLFTIGFLYFIISNYLADFDFFEDSRLILLVFIFPILLVVVSRRIYAFEKQNQLDKIFKILDIEVEEKEPEKEWSLENIFIRLFTYPFCLFLIAINIFVIIPEGYYFLALGTFGCVAFYLITDLKMIFRKKIK